MPGLLYPLSLRADAYICYTRVTEDVIRRRAEQSEAVGSVPMTAPATKMAYQRARRRPSPPRKQNGTGGAKDLTEERVSHQ